MDKDVDFRVKQIVSRLFQLDSASVTGDFSPDNVKAWDSLQHLNLVTVLEEEFGLVFNEEEIVQMLNVGLISAIINERLSLADELK